MVSSDESDSASSADGNEPLEPLGGWERGGAMVIGLICGVAGGYTAFERSNQAGTATLLVLAAIFLLIGIQGTPLIKFGSNSGSVELERRRKREVREALEQAREDKNPEKAEGIIEGVNLVAPTLIPKSYNTYLQYEEDVANALSATGYRVSREVRIRQAMVDLEIKKNDRTVYAELRYLKGPVQLRMVREVIGLAALLSAPVLLVANNELAASGRDLLSHFRIGFVQWRGEEDNRELYSALERLFTEI